MGLTIKRFREEGGSHTVELLGEPVTFTYRRPKTPQILGFERASAEYQSALSKYQEEVAALKAKLEVGDDWQAFVAAAREAGEQLPAFSFSPEALEPLVGFCDDHIIRVDGIDDIESAWGENDLDIRQDILDTLRVDQLIAFHAEIVQSVNLAESEKKRSTHSAGGSTSTTPASATPATPSPDYTSSPHGDPTATSTGSTQQPSDSTPNGLASSSEVAPP